MKEKTKRIVNRISKGVILFCILANMGIIILLASVLHQVTENCAVTYGFTDKLGDDFVINTSAVSNISICENMSAVETSYCLNEIFVEIFEYVPTDDYDYENFSQVDEYIRQNGGDCHESSMWFKLAAEELEVHSGYHPITMAIENSTDPAVRYMHAFAVISDIDAYCLLDQGMRVSCYEFNSTGIQLNSTIFIT